MSKTTLGQRVSKLRIVKDLTREQLAELSGLSLEFITTLEEEDLYPSIGPLQKIARALGVRLGTFMDDLVAKDPVIIKKDACTSDLVMQKTRNNSVKYTYYSLGKGKSDRNMEPFLIEISPDEEETKTQQMHQGEEFIIVQAGKLLVRYGKDEHILLAGDSIYFNSTTPHYVTAYGDQPCTIYAVIYNPA
ncbi:cupin domain-containing protein [Desulfovibrio litoralis]|uniref:Transcriptional regulator, XRE family with cupin sensor n=1 Tax=Desulfovibrio litoralis DSM 11393 TaxID=1121455 RepID=A0A1M7RTJ3_9BACT|nr:cupin domain-containing protein [Desulfovibrio litoralis]SHN49633.1 transcriptional regulator, XRE family with cupin sensor [Desulfovibrio litoralis DSM 11393]